MKYNETYHVENIKNYLKSSLGGYNYEIFDFIQDYYTLNNDMVVREDESDGLIFEVKYTKEFEKAFSLWALSK